MANTYTLISSVTVSAGGASSIDFTSIPNTYSDLVVIHSLRTSRSAYQESIKLSFNGSTSSQTNRRLYTDGSGISSTTDTLMYGGQATGSTATASTFGNSKIYITNYTNSNGKASFEEGTTENNATNILLDINANFWANSSVVNQITLTPENGGTIQQYSTAYLYGIKNS
jgi:hypothetical protein